MLPFIYRGLGRTAASIRFNDVGRVKVNGREYYTKRRLLWSPLLVTAANAYARAVGPPMRMLHEHQWAEYEERAFRELLDWGKPIREGRRLLLPAVKGRTLQAVLAISAPDVQRSAAELSARELASLHRRSIEHPFTGRLQPFSHADATAGNVLVDLTATRATWLDFETVHPPEMPACLRQADDLRTLLCGVAGLVPAQALPGVCGSVLEAYDNTTVLNALGETFHYWDRRKLRRLLAIPKVNEDQWKALMAVVGSRVGTE